jgi:hypothetical protein
MSREPTATLTPALSQGAVAVESMATITVVYSILLVMLLMVCSTIMFSGVLVTHFRLVEVKSLNDFDVDKSKTLSPISVNKNFNLLDKKLECPPLTASLKIDVNAKADAMASIGVAASGTIVPPKIEDFALIAGLKANLDGSLTMAAGLTVRPLHLCYEVDFHDYL